MARALLLAAIAACVLSAQAPPGVPAEPPEEDDALAGHRQYVFNPLQAKKEITTGDFYTKRGNHKAAAGRYLEATLWDEFSPDGHFKLGEAREKLKDYDGAREAFTRFIALTPDKKKADDIRKRMAKWPAATNAK